MPTSIPSIIIPAHNEEDTIYSTLAALSPENNTDNFQIVVSCNGCTDNTLTIVKKNFPSVLCLSASQPSKALAIRNAEAVIDGFPRIYLDADIKLNAIDAKQLIEASKNNPNKLILPKSETNYSNSSFLVSLYYKHWYKTPFVKQLGFGCGTYCLSQQGRTLFKKWPKLISDDGFIRQLFNPEHIHIVDTACVEVMAPKTISGLIKIKTRSKYGNLELSQTSDTHIKERRSYPITLTNPFSLLTYLFVNLIAQYKAKNMYRNRTFSWLRDNSNRKN